MTLPELPTIPEPHELSDAAPAPLLNDESVTAKTALVAGFIAAIVWLGSMNVRAIISLDLLQFGTMEFKPNIHPYIERVIYGILAESSLLSMVSYLVAWVCGGVYLRFTPLKMRQHGWLLMSAIMFYIFTPVEVYTGILDFRLWLLDAGGSNDLVEFRKLFIHRLGALSGVPFIAIACYYTIVGLAIFRPFRKPYPASAPAGLN